MTKKNMKLKVVIMSLAAMLTFVAAPAAVYADETPMTTEEGNMYINLPGTDVVAVGTEENGAQTAAAEPSVTAAQGSSQTAQTAQTAASAATQVSSFPKTSSAHPDTMPYLLILTLAVVAAFIYRHNMVLDRRNDSREEHDAEMAEFRLQCESARQV